MLPGWSAIASSDTSASAQRNPLGHGTHAGASSALAATAFAASTAGVARAVAAAVAVTVGKDAVAVVRIMPTGHTQRVKVVSAMAGAWHAQHCATEAGRVLSAAAESAEAPEDDAPDVAGSVLVLTNTVIIDLLLLLVLPLPLPPHGAHTNAALSEPGSHWAIATEKSGAHTVCEYADARSSVGAYE